MAEFTEIPLGEDLRKAGSLNLTEASIRTDKRTPFADIAFERDGIPSTKLLRLDRGKRSFIDSPDDPEDAKELHRLAPLITDYLAPRISDARQNRRDMGADAAHQ